MEGKGNNQLAGRTMGKTKAEELALNQRDISIAEFFERNRHLLGFDSKRKALLTTIKEAVDNSLDACEEAHILPEIHVEVVDLGNDRFQVIVEDNGPGIVEAQIPKIFAQLLYGSKFHVLRQQRGQQGIGISAAALYGQLTTGKPIHIISRISEKHDAHYYELMIDTQTNTPKILKKETIQWKKGSGTKVILEIEATYSKNVDEYLKETAIINPHATLLYKNSRESGLQRFGRVVKELPIAPKEIKPHPHGIELGMLLKMLQLANANSVTQFLQEEFSRISPQIARTILKKSNISFSLKPKAIQRSQAEKLLEVIRETKIMAPPSNCLSPIGTDLLERGLKKEVDAEFLTSAVRPPAVYRGNPFIVEAVLAYGGKLKEDASTLMRFANRVPLLYQQGGCAISKAVLSTNWKSYGLQQPKNGFPEGPIVLAVHFASVWVPFTSEAKEAVAHYPEIIKEMRLALQEVGRKLAGYLRKRKKVGDEIKKRAYIEQYIPHMASAIRDILELDSKEEETIKSSLKEILEKSRKVNIVIEDVTAETEKDVKRERLGLDLFGEEREDE